MTAGSFVAVPLPPVLDASAAPSLVAALLCLRGRPVRLDASQVQKIGTLGVQVLASARVTWQADRVAMRVDRPTATFSEALSLLGITMDTEGIAS